ncbi:hypothetical protein TYRP_011315 [Tyrophagus putrescentiae]|nr:hypothetical protein TYRP_011315 [Tyrophagus putrescentiae]
MSESLDEHNAVALIAALKKKLLQTITSFESDDVISHHLNEHALEELLEKVLVYMCGNFFTEPAKDIFENFQLERELVEQDVLGAFMVHLDRLSVNASRRLLRAFHHLLTAYAYQTRQPVVEWLLERGDYLLETLCRFLVGKQHFNSASSTVAAELLSLLCQHSELLARKLVNMADLEEEEEEEKVVYSSSNNQSSTGGTFYLRLLHSLGEHNQQQSPMVAVMNSGGHQLADQFKFLEALLLSHDDVANYAFTRDLHALIAAFNRLLSSSTHAFIRLQALTLFGSLIQNRKLQSLLRAYTGSLDNFKLFFQWTYDSQQGSSGSGSSKEEIIKTFEIFRLFLLNNANKESAAFRGFLTENVLAVTTIIDRAEKVRSYSDLALMYSEYKDIRETVDVMTGNVKVKSARKCRFGRTDSSDSI